MAGDFCLANVIEKLHELRNIEVEKLKAGNKDSLKSKLELDRAIKCLSFCNKNNLFTNTNENYQVIELPMTSDLYSEYRIIDDCETEDRNMWKELELDNNKLFLHPGDIVITK
ncbi:hypothetical protein [Ruminiclostridium cellobioparum]|uniref:hypothetical protein n=1 Tax=Ruminiclostridium cellobioparum TaxID=29355 RepID=UPI0028B1F5EC|nr:hypothetical protein [Ruminiclostridium cellobioparum]